MQRLLIDCQHWGYGAIDIRCSYKVSESVGLTDSAQTSPKRMSHVFNKIQIGRTLMPSYLVYYLVMVTRRSGVVVLEDQAWIMLCHEWHPGYQQ